MLQIDTCGVLSNRIVLNVSIQSDPYNDCVALKATFDRQNDGCMHCCRMLCENLHPHAMGGFCKNVCLNKCAVVSGPPPDILQLRIAPGFYGDCAIFIWEMAPETAYTDSIVTVEVVFKSSNSSIPLKVLSKSGLTQTMACGFLLGTRIFETKARVVGKMYETQWFSFPSQFYFEVTTSPSSVQNDSLKFNTVVLHKKVLVVASWNPPQNHGGVDISYYIVRMFLMNGSIFNFTQQACSMCSVMWFLDEIEIVENQCTVEIIASNKYDKQSKFSIPCIDAVHFEEALNPIVALSPGGVHTARLNDMIVSAGLWSISQGFSVFDPLHLCKFLHVSYTTEGRFENVQEIRIRPVQQQDSSWCTYEIAVLASQHGDCSDITVH